MNKNSGTISRQKRESMVKEQLVARGIYDERVLNAMSAIPRELFVSGELTAHTYEDHPLPIGYNQTISQPYIVALMTQLCMICGNEKILEIGSGSGYQTAILASLGYEVYSIERLKPLAVKAEKILKNNGFTNARIIHGDGYLGLAENAPFDVILLTAAPETIPGRLIEQLDDNGRLVAPVGDTVQKLIRITRCGNSVNSEDLIYVRFVPMLAGVN